MSSRGRLCCWATMGTGRDKGIEIPLLEFESPLKFKLPDRDEFVLERLSLDTGKMGTPVIEDADASRLLLLRKSIYR